MSIFDRLGTVFKSYVNDVDAERAKSRTKRSYGGDPDLDAAFDELDDFLKNGATSGGGSAGSGGNRKKEQQYGKKPQPPKKTDEIKEAFAELGLGVGASAEECKTAYKKLLKIHHPDRHASHEGNFKKATERCARINAAYDKIEKWRSEKK
ncbi:MAG: J domain-containing protein [Spirochaetes bacterium]|nr:J domain-containing protein [Spirochaetota bacterium]